METNPYQSAFRRLRGTFIAAAIFSAAVNILMLTGPLFMLQVYDRVLSSGSLATLQGLFVMVVLAYAFLGLYDFLRIRVMSRAAYKLDEEVGGLAFDHWAKAGIGAHTGRGRPLNDLATVRGFLSSPSMLGFFDLPWVPFYLIVVFLLHSWLGYLALFGLIVVTLAALANQFFTHAHFSKAMNMDGSEAFFVDQVHRNGEAILPMGMLGNIRRHWRQMHAKGLHTGQIGGDRAEGFASFSKSFRLLLQSALLGLGGYLALKQEISPGMIVAASIIAGRALAPIDQVIGQWRNVVRAKDAHGRLKQALGETPTADARTELPQPTGKLEVKGLTKFTPDQQKRSDRPPVLSDITFSLEPGDGLGVIGPSASGKTTLARLLVNAWKADAGEIRLDGAMLDQWRSKDLGQHIGYLPQSVELLSGSIRDNIARFDPQASDEDVITAAQLAGVHEVVLGLDDGYNTMIGYGAPGLSGGQIQRIGLARAVFGSPKLIILDEPNSNLDAEGDEALAQAIANLRNQGRVVIVMAHRPSAIASVNKIMVLNNGQIADFGEKADVLRRATRPANQPPTGRKAGPIKQTQNGPSGGAQSIAS